MLTPLAKALLVAVFVLLGLNAATAKADSGAGRRRIGAFIFYTVTLLFGAGLTQREVWPFTTWPLVAGFVASPTEHPRFLALDVDGIEHEIDFRAWAPLEFDEFIAWEEKNFAGLDRQAQDRVAAYLLGILEQARVQWAAGTPYLPFERRLGPFSAPFFLGHPVRWVAGSRVPPRPFTGLRLYRESWDIEERVRDPAKVRRRLAYEYRK